MTELIAFTSLGISLKSFDPLKEKRLPCIPLTLGRGKRVNLNAARRAKISALALTRVLPLF